MTSLLDTLVELSDVTVEQRLEHGSSLLSDCLMTSSVISFSGVILDQLTSHSLPSMSAIA